MLIFRNEATGTHFVVDPKLDTVIFLNNRHHNTFVEFECMLGGVIYLVLPDLKTVNVFRKHIKTGIIHNMSDVDARRTLLEHYPEYFI